MSAGDLLERSQQLQMLQAHLQQARSGSGRLVFLSGEAGIGKTSLVRRFCAGLSLQDRVLQGGCDPMAAPRPLAPLFDMVSELGPKVAEPLAGDARGPIFDALLQELRTAGRTTVLVVEDVHWADDATLDLLRFLARRVGAAPALVLATYRQDEVGPRHPLRMVIGDLATSSAVARLAVPPLTPAAVALLVEREGMGDHVEAEHLHRVTGGNPFFVTELLAARGNDVPASVQDAVLARVGRLPASARHLLDLACVMGAQIDPALLQSLGADLDAVEQCVAAGMLQSSEASLSFRHDLVRDALERSLSVAKRRELHRTVLHGMEASGDPERDLAMLAHHAAESGDAEAIVRIAPMAARRAAQLGAHKEARAQYQRALPYLDRLPDLEHVQLLERYATECSICDHLEESARVRREVVFRWRHLDRPDRVGMNLSILAQVLIGLGRHVEAERTNREAVDVLERIEPGPELARAYWYQTSLRMQDRDADAAVHWGERAIDLASSLGETAIAGNAHLAMGTALLFAERPGGREHIDRAIAIARELGLPHLLTNAWLNLGSAAVASCRLQEAHDELTRAIEHAEEHEHDFQRFICLALKALVHLHRGEWNPASDMALQVIERPNVSAAARLPALLVLGRVRVRRGDPEAGEVLDEALLLAERTGTYRTTMIRAARAEAAWLAGDEDAVRAEASGAYATALEGGHPWFSGELGYWLWKVGELETLPEPAAEPYVLEVSGRSIEAALAWQRLGCPYEAARARAERGDETGLRAAFEAFTALGARPAAAATARKLRESGARNIPRGPRAATRSHPAQLTPREVEVLELIAQGLRNGEIAQRHAVSTRTVDHQVSALLAKLGARTRTDAVARARAIGVLTQHRQEKHQR